jgi:hypothetical protein
LPFFLPPVRLFLAPAVLIALLVINMEVNMAKVQWLLIGIVGLAIAFVVRETLLSFINLPALVITSVVHLPPPVSVILGKPQGLSPLFVLFDERIYYSEKHLAQIINWRSSII